MFRTRISRSLLVIALGGAIAALPVSVGMVLTPSEAIAKPGGGHGGGGGRVHGGGGGRGAGRAVHGHAPRMMRGGGAHFRAARAAPRFHVGRAAHAPRIRAVRGGHGGRIARPHVARVHVARAHALRASQQARFARGNRIGRAAQASPFIAAGRRGRLAAVAATGALPARHFVLPSTFDRRRGVARLAPGVLLYPALAWTPLYAGLFWPSPAYVEYWPYGYEPILEGAFGEGVFTGYGLAPFGPSRRRTAVLQPGPAVFDTLCRGQASLETDSTADALAEVIEPDDKQRAALDAFRQATAKAAELIRTSCPASLPAGPIGRLEVMERQTGLVLEALGIIRPALGELEGSLSDAQRARFAALTASRQRRAGDKRAATLACERQAASLTDWPVERIAEAVRPTQEQRDKLVDLWAASMKSASSLKVECPQDIPATPLARLEMMQRQLEATRNAIKAVRTALADFYNDLTVDQKARFDQMSGPARG
jgi:LTXXQ motif family protein